MSRRFDLLYLRRRSSNAHKRYFRHGDPFCLLGSFVSSLRHTLNEDFHPFDILVLFLAENAPLHALSIVDLMAVFRYIVVDDPEAEASWRKVFINEDAIPPFFPVGESAVVKYVDRCVRVVKGHDDESV